MEFDPSFCLPTDHGLPRFDIGAFGARPDSKALQTAAFQAAIDAAGAADGGIVFIPPGRYITGALHLRDGIQLQLPAGAVLAGSSDWRDYGAGEWSDALIKGVGVRNVSIRGLGRIDGVDAERPGGEEGFRGPHAICFSEAEGIHLEGVRLCRAGNYAALFQKCRRISVTDVTFEGGHDGLHVQGCEDIQVLCCDFRTGDDCIAGTDNRRFLAEDCRFNTSCNAFRLGAMQLTVRDCRFQGPGEYAHKITERAGAPRHGMLAAFTHFSPTDRQPQWPSDQWHIEGCRMDRIRAVYLYDHEQGLWQTGQPAKRLCFADISATRVEQPITIVGDRQRQLDLTLENVFIELDLAHAAQPLLDIRQFGWLRLRNFDGENDRMAPLVWARDGEGIECAASRSLGSSEGLRVERVGKVIRI